MIQSYQDLRVWRAAMDFAVDAHRAAVAYSRGPSRALADQMRRAAISIPSNIAEGYGRESPKSYVQFLKIARGSLNEAETHILLAQRLGLIDGPRAAALLISTEGIGKMLNGLMKSLAMRKEAEGA